MKKLKIIQQIQSFSKLITFIWLGAWVETLLFSQIATLLHCGDATAIQYINENVLQVGLIICGFYFSTKCVENVAQGIEAHIESGRQVHKEVESVTFEEQTEYNEEKVEVKE